MVKSKRILGALLTAGLTIAGCETTQQEPTLKVQNPLSSLNYKKEVPPQVAQAVTLLKEGRYREASQFINLALQADSKSVVFHVLNGLTYEILAKGGDASGIELAAIGYQNAINIDPANIFAIRQLAKLKYNEKLYNEAQELYANALLKKPDEAELWHELAAASYYAYDAKTAVSAIDKAEKLKPKDPLVQRSAAMIYAALGDFKTAKKYADLFKDKVGSGPDVDYVIERLNDWQSLYQSGRIKLAAAKTTIDLPPPPPPPGSDTQVEASGGPSESAASAAASAAPSDIGKENVAESTLKAPFVQESGMTSAENGSQIVIDCYILRISEEASTSKGNNILESLAITLTPGGLSTFRNSLWGSGAANFPGSATAAGTGSSATTSPDVGYKSFAGGTNSVFTPGSQQFSLNNKGSITGQVFTGGISWAGLTYSLNIANAIDERIEIVSRPSLMTFVNKPSIFFSGDNLVTGFTGQFGGSIANYPVGVTLEVTPKQLEGDLLTLDIGIEGSLIAEPDPQLSQTVKVATTRIDTFGKIRLGETLMLGGLYERTQLSRKDGFPGLQDIPFVQYFFSNEQTLSTRKSIVFLLTPRSPAAVRTHVTRAMAREAVEPHLSELSARNPNWLHTHPNLTQIFQYLSRDPIIYYEFRAGDILPPSWGMNIPLSEKIEQLGAFLYY